MNTSIKKKGFIAGIDLPSTLISLLIIAVFGAMYAESVIDDRYNSAMDKAKSNAKVLFSNIFYEDGYIVSTEQPNCSDAITTADITAQRIIQCTGIKVNYLKEATAGQEKDPTQSFVRYLTQYKNGCDFYFSPVAGKYDELYAFITCDLGIYSIEKELIEREWVNFFNTEFPQEVVKIEQDSISIDTDTGGDRKDGMLRIRFQK